MGDGHLYRYIDSKTSKYKTSYYYDKIHKGNILNETYVGPDNPVNLFTGEDDYGQAPQDYVDYAGYLHDKGYDRHKARGKFDAKNNLDVLGIDIELTKMSTEAISMWRNDAIDPITGKEGSIDLQVTGNAVRIYFEPIVRAKQSAMDYISKQVNSKPDMTVKSALKSYNKENKTEFTTTLTRNDLKK